MLTGFKARRPGLSKGRAQSRHCPRAECRVWWLQRRADALMWAPSHFQFALSRRWSRFVPVARGWGM